jgi:hypothetical protein
MGLCARVCSGAAPVATPNYDQRSVHLAPIMESVLTLFNNVSSGL